MNELTYIIPNYETINYTLCCYNSIRKNTDKNNNIIIVDDGSKDNSWNLIQILRKSDVNLTIYQNNKNYGIAYTYNQAVDLCKTEKFIMLHSDMYILPDHDKIMLEEFKKWDFLTTYRIEPPIYPASKDKLQMDFGQNLETFDENKLLKWYKDYNNIGGFLRMCFPWMTRKKVFNRINGVDELFLKFLVDDDDFYLRIAMAGYKYWQTWKTCVYHFCSRTTKYKNDDINQQGTPEWNKQYERSTRNFIRKWGTGQNNTYLPDMSMNVNLKKYDIGFVINNCDANILYHAEPYANTIYVDIPIEPYIQKSQENTLLNMKERVKNIHDEKTNDIIISFDGKQLNQDNFRILTKFQEIINDSGSVGLYNLDIFKVDIKKLQPIDKEELIVNKFRNINGYNW